MIVAVQKGLGAISEQLRSLGYDVVTYGEYRHPIDAVVFVGGTMDVFSNHPQIMSGHGQTHGVLMVNASNKTIAEVDAILKRRVYSPLF